MPETVSYVTATQAARLIGVNERTVRLWVNHGKLSAHQPAPNRLEIPMSEVDRVIAERQARESLDLIPTPRELAGRLAELQEEINAIQPGSSPDLAGITSKINDLDARLQRLEQMINTPTPAAPRPAARPARPAIERSIGADTTLPPGAMLARDFAILYGVKPRTFLDHIVKGKNGELAPAGHRPKPGRPGETEHYILPEQREQVLDFWRRQHVAFVVPQASEGEEN